MIAPAPLWIPIRFAPRGQTCNWCRRTLRLVAAMQRLQLHTIGWYNRTDRTFECLDCRTEGARAEAARAAFDRAKASACSAPTS